MPAKIVTSPCPACAGRKFVACWKCDGSGQVQWGDCWPCAGTGLGKDPCRNCKGEGTTSERMWMPDDLAEAAEVVKEIEETAGKSQDVGLLARMYWRAFNACSLEGREALFPATHQERVKAATAQAAGATIVKP